jgi:stage IV sporulation protein FB
MRWALPIGHLFGLSVRVHLSVLFLMAVLLILPTARTEALLGASIGLFLALVVHELAHALTARRFGLQPSQVVLLPLGGTTRLATEPRSPRQELLVAMAGPLANLVVGGVGFAILWAADAPGATWGPLPEDVTGWSAALPVFLWVNLTLGGTNLLPAFPLDGGRILRAALTGWLGRVGATRAAARLGQLTALALVVLGLLEGQPLAGLAGLLIFFGAYAEQRQVVIADIIGNRTVADVMAPVGRVFGIATPLREVLDTLRDEPESRACVVTFGDRVLGVLYRAVAAQAAAAGKLDLALGDLVDRQVVETTAGTSLRELLTRMGEHQSRAAVVRGAAGIDGVVLIEQVVQEIRASRHPGF